MRNETGKDAPVVLLLRFLSTQKMKVKQVRNEVGKDVSMVLLLHFLTIQKMKKRRHR